MAILLDPTERYIHPGTARTYFGGPNAVALMTAVTRLEMNAMFDTTGQMSEASGWEQSAENVAVPDGGSRFTSQVAGRITPSDPSLIFYASKDTDDVRSLIHQDDLAYVLHLHGGDVPGQKMDVWYVRCRSVSKPIDYGGTAAGMINIQFSVLSPPAIDVVIPAI